MTAPHQQWSDPPPQPQWQPTQTWYPPPPQQGAPQPWYPQQPPMQQVPILVPMPYPVPKRPMSVLSQASWWFLGGAIFGMVLGMLAWPHAPSDDYSLISFMFTGAALGGTIAWFVGLIVGAIVVAARKSDP